jgi:c-di-GMP-binding flagellar brake protein YcgR
MDKIVELVYSDKRKGERLYLPLNVFYSLSEDSRPVGPVVLDNISGGGLKFVSAYALKKNSELYLTINLLDGHKPIKCKATVSWSQHSYSNNMYYIGVKFSNMAKSDRQRYVSYICEKILTKYLDEKGNLIR